MTTTTRLIAQLRRVERILAPLPIQFSGMSRVSRMLSRLTAPVLVTQQVLLDSPEQMVAFGESRLDASLREAEGAKELLIEIIRRAAQDWVLYRTSNKPEQRQLADESYTWLFEEDEDHPNYKVRIAEHKELTAFVNICEVLDMSPTRVRGYICRLTPERVRASSHQVVKIQTEPDEEEKPKKRQPVDFDDLILSMLPPPEAYR
jgi:hypothetical protein